VLANPVEFIHRKQIYNFVPIKSPNSYVIAGRIGRTKTVLENKPPEDSYEPFERESHHAALLLIDPSHHDDGQKVAFESKQSTGRSFPVFSPPYSAGGLLKADVARISL